ncbi:MAG: hypothetical protein QOE14_2676 [Humisphaera sp.]|nr:hypothetical protein [Humisphaera sp.]
MPAQVLSYASPGSAPMHAAGYTGLWRQGDRVVATRDADLGDACVKCGAAAAGWRWNKTLYWHEPWLYVLIFFPGLLIYAIVALALRKGAKVSVGLCPAHRKRRNTGILLVVLLTLLGIVSMIGGMIIASDKNGEWGFLGVLAGFGMIIAAVIIGNTMTRVLTAKKIDDHYAWYGGASEVYLRTLDSIG